MEFNPEERNSTGGIVGAPSMTTIDILVISVALVVLPWLVFLVNPRVSLAAWVVTLSVQLPFTMPGFPSVRPAISDLFLPTMLLGWLMYVSRGRLRRYPHTRSFNRSMFLFVAYFLAVGSAMSIYSIGTLTQWAVINKDIGIINLTLTTFVAVSLLNSYEYITAILNVYIISSMAINVAALAGGVGLYVFGIPNIMMREGAGIRLVGLMINPGSYGGYMVCVALVQFALLIGGGRLLVIPRILQWVNMVFLAVAILMTLSRSSLLGLGAGILVLPLYFRARSGLGIAVFLALLVIALYVSRSYVSDETYSVAEGVMLNVRTVDERININKLALDKLMSSPMTLIFGIGVGVFYATSAETLGLPLVVHNTFVWVLSELGVIGFVLFSAMVVVSLLHAHAVARSTSPLRSLAVGIVCALVSVLAWFLGTEGLYHRHVWFLMAISECCYRFHLSSLPSKSEASAHVSAEFSPIPGVHVAR